MYKSMNWLKFLLTKLAQQGSINYLLKSNPNLFKEYQDKKKNIVIPSQYTGEAGEILKKWIFYRIKQGDNIRLDALDVILVNPLDKAKSWFTKPDFTFSDLEKKNEEYHEKLKETENRAYISKYPITILKKYNNGLAWGRLETSFCREYGDSLGHCGNAAGEYDYTQRIYTFYDTTTNIHYLTFIYHENGILGEAKAYGNSKPPIDKIRILNREDLFSVDAQQVYKDLLLLKDKDQYIWNSIRGAGYKPENNFGFQDLNEKNKEEIKKERENIDDYFSYKKGKDSKDLHFFEDGEIYFNKNITKEQFKDLILSEFFLFSYKNTYEYIVKFNLYQDENVINNIAKYPRNAYKLASSLQFDLNKINDKIIDSISGSYGLSIELAAELDFDINKIPKKIIESIATDSNYAIYFARKTNFDLTKIPEEIIKSISENLGSSVEFARYVDFDFNKIPKIIMDKIKENPTASYNFVIGVNFDLNKIPKEIIEIISRHPEYCYDFAKNFNFDLTKIPRIIIEGIIEKQHYRDKLFNQLKNRNIKIRNWMKKYKKERY